MSISLKILPAIALAVALSPLAAQARGDHPPGPAQYYLAPLHHDPVMTGSATIDQPTTIYSGRAAQNHPPPAKYYLAPLHHDPVMTGSATIDQPTTIYSGRAAQKWPVADGG